MNLYPEVEREDRIERVLNDDVLGDIFGFAVPDYYGPFDMGRVARMLLLQEVNTRIECDLEWFDRCGYGYTTITLPNRSYLLGTDSVIMARVMNMQVEVMQKARWFSQCWDSYATISQTLPQGTATNHRLFLLIADVGIRAVPVGPLKLASPESMLPRLVHIQLALDNGPTVLSKIRATLASKQLLLLMLKAELFKRILTGRTVLAFSEEPEQNTLSSQCAVVVQRQRELWMAVYALITHVLGGVVSFVLAVLSSFYRVVAATESTTIEALCDCLTLVVFCWASYRVAKWSHSLYFWVFPRFTLAEKGEAVTNYFVQTRATPCGTFYEFVVDGKKISIPMRSQVAAEFTEEMSMPGSDYYASVQRPVGCILTRYEDTECVEFGAFWRCEDWLVTARHNAQALSCGTADVYLGGCVKVKNTFRLNLKNLMSVERKRFALEGNPFDETDLDAFAMKLTTKEWAGLGITKASVKHPSRYGQAVNAAGFQGGLLVTSGGKTVDGSGIHALFHTASTNKGFSGSPLFAGNHVVGMHIGAGVKENIAVRVESIAHRLFRPEYSSDFEISENSFDFKSDGNSVEIHDSPGYEYSTLDRRGRVRHGYAEEDFGANWKSQKELSRRAQFEDEDEDVADAAARKAFHKNLWKPINPSKNWGDYEEENVDTSVKSMTVTCHARKVVPPVLKNPYYAELDTEQAVHCNSTAKEQLVSVKYITDSVEELVSLGYEPGTFVYPDINPGSEEKSIRLHLELFGKRVEAISDPPTERETERAVYLVTEMMAANRFEPDVDYKSQQNFVRIIDSSLVKDSKSPGHPYQGQGMAQNSSVISKLTKQGLAEVVEREWSSSFDLKDFIKSEVHKKAKVESGFLRVVTGLPLHKTIKHQAIFRNFMDKAVEQWTKSPIKFAFTPMTPGHIEHLADWFGGRKVYGLDKTNWDYMFFAYLFEICKQVTMRLAVQPIDMSDAAFEEYLLDVAGSCDEVCYTAVHRASNGKRFKPIPEGGMKSGWLCTILFNSIAQVVIDVLTKIRMGLSDEEILSDEYRMMAGGDDTGNTFPDSFDVEKYRTEALKLGIEMGEFECTNTLNGYEFFSTVLYTHEGVWKYRPVRFTKHIEKLKTTKVDDLASALSCHMINYCWDSKKFRFFEKMYRTLKKDLPDHFPLNLLKPQRQLQFKCKGYDAA